MKRRSKAGGEPIKGGRREAQEPKRNAPKVAARRSSSNDAQKTEVTRLARERNDALDQLKSISEVLGVISRSNFDLQPCCKVLRLMWHGFVARMGRQSFDLIVDCTISRPVTVLIQRSWRWSG